MSQKRIEKEELKRFIEVNEGVKEQIGKHESQLVETKYYKDLVIETKLGPVSLGETYVTIERNKEGDMEYHFRWVKENDNGEKTIEEKMVLDKDGNVFCIDGLKGALGNSQMDVEELFKENDKEKGRLAGSIKEKDEKDETSKEENKENRNDEQKQVEKDLRSEGQDLKLSCFRKITDPHLQERMPSVFENSSEYAVAYSDTMSSFVILQKSTEIGENGDKVEKWKINESVQKSGTNYEPIISVSANGNELKQKVPMTILPVENVPNQKIAITMDPENYGKIDMETVNVMTCGKELAGHKEMLGRSTGLEGEGNVNGEGVEDYELRQRLDRSGKDITGNPTAQDELIHGAKK